MQKKLERVVSGADKYKSLVINPALDFTRKYLQVFAAGILARLAEMFCAQSERKQQSDCRDLPDLDAKSWQISRTKISGQDRSRWISGQNVIGSFADR